MNHQLKRTTRVALIMISAAVILCGVGRSSLFAKEELTIYTYESLGWITKSSIPAFENKYDCSVKVVKFTDAGNIVARMKLEKKNGKADVALGLTPSLVALAKKEGLLSKYRSSSLSRVTEKQVLFDPDYATPYDFGALAIVYNPSKMKKEPVSFADLRAMPRSLIIEDPRTSSTGQDFLLWTIALYGKNWKQFWIDMKSSILTVTPGWDEAFAKFEAGEAPMMLSYATDGAYAWENYKSLKYKAFIPQEGGFLQIESGCLINGTKHEKLARLFVDFLLDEQFQSQIPLNQWMFPVTAVKLPESFAHAVKPAKTVKLSQKDLSENIERYLKEWEEIFR